jgi:2-desacetyl-2-hydroxyethyl bacteriochlorophyllide A dehydrogenase
MQRRALFFTGPYSVAIQSEDTPTPSQGEVLIRTRLSAISPGTEMLIYRDQMPKGMASDTTIAALEGQLVYPFKYGYAAVGEIVQCGPGVAEEWLGKNVFAFNPHESHFTAKVASLHSLPDGISVEEAIFLPNMETAVNFAMDGKPLIGERVAIFGQGIVGLLTTALLARYPLTELITFDQHALRRKASLSLGASQSMDPREISAADFKDFDLMYELSGSPSALDQAISLAGFDSRIVIGSWYGEKKASLDLGGDFHRNRIKLISSQVSTLAAEFGGRWDKARRLDLTWQILAKVKPSQFITQRLPLERAAEAYRSIDEKPQDCIQVIFDYG